MEHRQVNNSSLVKSVCWFLRGIAFEDLTQAEVLIFHLMENVGLLRLEGEFKEVALTEEAKSL
jgi:hypothetical protein